MLLATRYITWTRMWAARVETAAQDRFYSRPVAAFMVPLLSSCSLEYDLSGKGHMFML